MWGVAFTACVVFFFFFRKSKQCRFAVWVARRPGSISSKKDINKSLVWRVLRCLSKRGISRFCCSRAVSACWVGAHGAWRLLNSLRIETQFLERLQSVGVVDGAAHTKKDDVESNGGSLKNVAEVFVLFLCEALADLELKKERSSYAGD